MIKISSYFLFLYCLIFVLLILLFPLVIRLSYVLRINENYSNGGPTYQTRYNEHYLSIQRVMHDFMSYSAPNASPQTYFTKSNFSLVGDNFADESNETYRADDGEKLPLAVSVFNDLRTRILDDLVNYIHNRAEFVLIFDKPNFQGKMYLIPATRSHTWNSNIFRPKQYVPRPSFLELERLDAEGEEKGKERKEGKRNMNMNMNIEAFKVDDDIEAENGENGENEENGEQDESSPPSPFQASSLKPHVPLDVFIPKFQLFYGRKFSCIIPKDVVLEFIPVQKEAKSSEPMILREGKHDLVTYYMSPLLRFSVHKKTMRDGF